MHAVMLCRFMILTTPITNKQLWLSANDHLTDWKKKKFLCQEWWSEDWTIHAKREAHQPRSFYGKPCDSHAVFTLQVNPSTSLCPTLSAHIELHVTSQSSIIITRGTQSQPVFICIIVWVKVYNPHMYVEVASITSNAIHWVLLNMLCT